MFTPFLSQSPLDTQRAGERLGRLARPATVIGLSGELGSGKTVFVRGLARGFLGEHAPLVTSPTFVLLRVYSAGGRTVHHLDAYRLQGAEDFRSAGLEDCFSDSEALTCIEWPERVAQALPRERLEIRFEHLGPNQRLISAAHSCPAMCALAENWASQLASTSRRKDETA
jgi:tRNA threonylcarbamoyladenosine biosynthesis protein TsaE